VDTTERMVGDINLFLTPWEDDDDESAVKADHDVDYCNAEVDIMIASTADRGRGLGRAAVSAFINFIWKNLDSILAEYRDCQAEASTPERKRLMLKDLVAKINASNQGSIALFKKLGFRQRGDVNYFGEIEMVLENFGKLGLIVRDEIEIEGYKELVYDRSRLTS
jgi:RimJ/RimL family protein N-acetyltransferase